MTGSWKLTALIVAGTVALAVPIRAEEPAKPAPASDKPASALDKQAKLEISETNFNYGYVVQDASIAHTYWLKNTGNDTLRITDVRPGCGCTKSALRQHDLAAGDSTDVELIFATGRYVSTVQKSATVVANSPGMTPALTFTATPVANPDSIPAVRLSPAILDLDSIPAGAQKKPGQYVLTVKNRTSAPVSLSLVSAPSSLMTVDVPDDPIKPDKDETILVKLSKAAADSAFTKSFTVELSDAAHTRFTVPIFRRAKSTLGAVAPTGH